MIQVDEQPQQLSVLIMAAGLGTRMKSNHAKVLHQLGGLPLITHVTRAAESLHPQSIVVVVGHQAEEVECFVQTAAARVEQRNGFVALVDCAWTQ